MAYHAMICIKSFYPSLSTTSMFSITSQTTSSISKSNHSPLSSENHRSLFVKPAKRGKQRAGGGALFALYYFPFNYQSRHAHNCFTTQLGTSCSFDSPGLARNEPTPGKQSQGDSTPSVLSFFCEGTLTIKPFMADESKKAQHLRRCSTQTIR